MITTVIVEIVLAGILLAGAIIGIVRGLILSIAKPVKWAGSLFSAAGLCVPFADYIVQPMIHTPITNQLSKFLLDKYSDITAETAKDTLPALIKFAAGAAGLDVSSLEAATSEEYILKLVDQTANHATRLVAMLISFLVLSLAFKILLNLVFWLVHKIFEAGLLGFVNKALGFVLNTAFAFVVAWGATALFTYFISLPGIADATWVTGFEGGFLYQMFKGINPIDLLLSF